MLALCPRPATVDGLPVFKDGVHIVVPDVLTDSQIQAMVRTRFLHEHPTFFTDRMPSLTNSAADIYDEAVIGRNAWMMYGSKKPGEPFAWEATFTCEFDCIHNTTGPLQPMLVHRYSG